MVVDYRINFTHVLEALLLEFSTKSQDIVVLQWHIFLNTIFIKIYFWSALKQASVQCFESIK